MASDAGGHGMTPTPRRLKLVMPQASPDQVVSQSPPSRGQSASNKASSGSPERPSYSPVTPTLTEAVLSTQQAALDNDQTTGEFIETPEALPISLGDNPDAIALRAALSILQMQRQQSLRDIRDLDKMKTAAMEDPEGFVEHLKSSNSSEPVRHGVDVDYVEASEDEEATVDGPGSSKFPKFPTAQNVVRAPPIEWSKYGIVGEPLDRMHDTQRTHPGSAPNATNGQQPHQIASPYRHFSDRITESKK